MVVQKCFSNHSDLKHSDLDLDLEIYDRNFLCARCMYTMYSKHTQISIWWWIRNKKQWNDDGDVAFGAMNLNEKWRAANLWRYTKNSIHQLLNQIHWNVMDRTFIEFDLATWITIYHSHLTITRMSYLQFSNNIYWNWSCMFADCVCYLRGMVNKLKF